MPPTVRLSRFLAFVLATALLHQASARADGGDAAVPEPLRPWTAWALKGAEQQRCAQIAGVHTCVFPTALALSVKAQEASFTYQVSLDEAGSVVLPGSSEVFPLAVREGKSALPVVDHSGSPTVQLPAGAHVLSGRFEFAEVPDSLKLPANLGSLRLEVLGASIPFPKREADGLVWLKQGAGSGEAERLSLSVHRRIDDGIPLLLTTRVHMSAGGKPREVLLPSVLVEGTRAIALKADVPSELTQEGALRVQIQAGEHDIEIDSIREQQTSRLTAPKAAAPWPDTEIWVFHNDEKLRHVELMGGAAIDPARTDLPAEFRGLPAYVMRQGQSLRFETRRRGEPEPPPNQLSIARALWLDLDGEGYTVRDEIRGTLTRAFRLDVEGAKLGHAVDHGQDQVITTYAGKDGVELRSRDVQLETEFRLPHARALLPAVGYGEDAHDLSATLHLPPGFMLLGAEGVDVVSGAWLQSWDLFDFFFVLLVSLAVAKVAGTRFGLCALVALTLTHHEPDAPAYAWLFLLAMVALHVALKRERLGPFIRGGFYFAAGCLVLVLLPFSVAQVRKALYPHLAQQGSTWDLALGTAHEPLSMALPEPALAPGADADAAFEAKDESVTEEMSVAKAGLRSLAGGGGQSYARRKQVASVEAKKLELDPNAVVQTGPGLPTWRFRSYALAWSGPVEKQQQVKLRIAPPWLTRTWDLASVLFSGLLLFALLRVFYRPRDEPPQAAPPIGKDETVRIAAALLALGASLWPLAARAEGAFPTPELLSQLRSRLTEPPACEPDCLSVSSLSVRVEPDRLSIVAEVHAQARAGYKAPGPLETWAPDAVRVDGKDALSALRADDGFLYVRLELGVHKVELSGPLPQSQAFTLALGSPPHQVRAVHPGFVVEGLRDDGRAEGSLSIRRELGSGDGESRVSQGLLQWFEVRREIALGVRFRVRTTVARLGLRSEATLLRLPLLPGEEVEQAELAESAGAVVIELARGESQKIFQSSLAPRAKLTLTAAEPSIRQGSVVHPYSEVWSFSPSVLYHVTFDGIAAVEHVDEQGTYEPEYRPYPGETLHVRAARLEGAEGASTTTDSARLNVTPGSRIEQSELNLHIRTSRGTTERLTFPQTAQLTHLRVDGSERPARFKDGVVEVHLDPGAHDVALSMQRLTGIGFNYQPLTLKSARPLTNVTTEVRVPDGRWLLFARGPAWGPAVLFWGYLLIVLMAAALLGQLTLSPLKTHQWVLLGLGLTQVESAVALIVVGWLFAMAARARRWPARPVLFNVLQVALVLLTLTALFCLSYAVHRGLVVQPSMQVEGMGSSDRLLRWYVDRTDGAFPTVSVWSVPLWIYKALMLLWALWLAASVIGWLRQSLSALRAGGGWRPRKPRTPPSPGNPKVALSDIEAAEAALRQEPAVRSTESDPRSGGA